MSAGTPDIPMEVYAYMAQLWAEECAKTEGTPPHRRNPTHRQTQI